MIAAASHNALTLFIVQATVIICFSRLIGVLAKRIGQPLVIAEVTAGILLGPSLLGWLFPGVKASLFPADSMAMLQLLSQVGLIFFMFLVGLELDPKLLKGRGHTSVFISHTSIIVPFVLGAVLALYLYPRLSDPEKVKFSSFTLFMGAAMSITAFPVLARILNERALMNTHVGAISIACAAVDDVTAWCVLAFVVSIVNASGMTDAVWTTLQAVGYILLMVFVVRPFLARLGARAASRETLSQNVVAVTFLLVLLSSWTTERIGIHALFGAFLMGAIMPRAEGFAHALAERLEDFVVVVMLPLFFAFSGLRTEVNLLDTPEMWLLCGLIIAVACAGKFGGSAIAARLTGLDWREASAIGILMNTRGLMELIVLNIGFDLGVISPKLFTMMVLMALVTTFMTTPLLHWIYPAERLRAASATATPVEATPTTPAVRPFSTLMCVANERTGPGLATLSAALAGPGGNSIALRLLRPAERTSAYLPPDEPKQTESNGLGPLLERSRQLGLAIEPISFVSSDVAEDICGVATARRVNLVLLGWHRPLVGYTTLGGTVYQVMNEASADVGILFDRGVNRIQRVLVPYSGGPHDKAALRLAQRLNSVSKCHVTVLHVVAPGRSKDDPRLGAKERMDSVFTEANNQHGELVFKVIEHGEPVTAALIEAERGFDLVVIGAAGEWGLEQRRFGLHPEPFIKHCPTSVLVVRGTRALIAT